LEDLKKVMKDIDLVYHLAARPGVMPSFSDSEIYHANNVTGTFNVLSAARKIGVKKVVFAGADEVAEIAYLTLQETDIELAGVVDNEKEVKINDSAKI
jgi:nucleoside-diphosphate-sugar epimerase